MTVSVPLPVETLENVQRFEADYQAFLTWRDSLPLEEQIELAFYGARVIGYALQDTQPLPVVKPVASSPVESTKQITPPAVSTPGTNKQGRKKVVK